MRTTINKTIHLYYKLSLGFDSSCKIVNLPCGRRLECFWFGTICGFPPKSWKCPTERLSIKQTISTLIYHKQRTVSPLLHMDAHLSRQTARTTWDLHSEVPVRWRHRSFRQRLRRVHLQRQRQALDTEDGRCVSRSFSRQHTGADSVHRWNDCSGCSRRHGTRLDWVVIYK